MNNIGWTDAEIRESREKSNEIKNAYKRGYDQARKEFERPDCSSKLEKYEKIAQIISEYKRQPSGNVFTNDKYFRRILEAFEVD